MESSALLNLDLPQMDFDETLLDKSMSQPNWYAIYTRSRHEFYVKRQLDHKEISNLLPLYTKISQWKDRKKEIQLPLFPGYLFVRIPLLNRMAVLATFGVVYIVGDGSASLPVPDESINTIQSFLTQGLKCDPHPYLKVGNRVRITEGPLSGIEGILIRKKNRTLLVVSVDLIQRSVSVEIESWKIERI
jgi:transcription termination/antitermination protein NusG